ncbi:hypothetical protein cypCar_00017554 [Cyprinus carpio]|nr:hypothetical protein cypCar_00017554 [Cyprinus carpio]
MDCDPFLAIVHSTKAMKSSRGSSSDDGALLAVFKFVQVSGGLWKKKRRKKRIVGHLGTAKLKILWVQDQSVVELVLNEYLGTSPDRTKIRDGFREMLGDFLFNIPARKVANYHRDAGAPVYMYEFQHPPSLLQKKRPSFVGSDHGDEVIFVLGFCFANGRIKLEEELSEEENELCRTVMAYWGNFARTGSPNGLGLTEWPKFGAEAEYLSIGLEQKPAKDLKGKHFTFMTQTLPRKIKERKEGKFRISIVSLRFPA